MSIAVIIVSFGRKALLQQTLETLRDSGFSAKHGTVTVVDNGSQADLRSMLCEWQPYITNLMFLSKNQGKPYAWNLGATITQEQCKTTGLTKPEFFLFCDSDLNFHKDWFETLTRAWNEHKHLPLGAISGFRWPAQPIDRLETGPTTQLNVVRFPTGCCVFMSVEAYQSNGSWDTQRLIRTVDTSYFRKVRERGFFCASIHPDSVIHHTGKEARTWRIDTGQPKYLP